jgi:hypothetical protein
MTRLCALVLAAAALAMALAATPTNAQTVCSAATPGSQADCYTHRTTCHYDPFATSCYTGAPTTCEQFYLDTVGCAQVVGCAVNSNNAQCYSVPASCTTLTTGVLCSQRSDCSWSGSACLSTPVAGSCATHTTGASCQAASCFWDTAVPGGPRCFFNLQEVTRELPCGTWSNYGQTTAYVCGMHGCAYTANLCFTIDSGALNVDSGYAATASVRYSTINTAILPHSTTFTTQVVMSMSDFFKPMTPVYHSIVLGYPTYPGSLQYGACTSVQSEPAFGTPLLPSTYLDQPGLVTRFVSRVQSAHDMTFGNADALDAAVTSAIAQWRVAGTSVIHRIDMLDGLLNVGASMQFDLDWCVNTCGCGKEVFPTYTQYEVPIGVLSRTNGDNVAAAVRNFTVSIYTYGSVQVSANSNNPFHVSIMPSTTSAANCPAGQQQRLWSIRATFDGVHESGRIVGLRSLADVSMVATGTAQTVGAPTNCFGSEPYEVIPPTSCVSGSCTTEIKFRTRCVPITSDGEALNLCSHQLPQDRMFEMGGDVAYPTNLNYLHSYYQRPKSWLASLGALGDPSPVPVGQDPSGVAADLVTITLNDAVLPTAFTNLTLTATFGFATTPDAMFGSSASFIELMNGETGIGTGIDERNRQLYFSKTITPVVFLPTLVERQTFGLNIDLATLRIYALSSTGAQIGTSFLAWSDIAPMVIRSPRQGLVGCSTCVMPAIATYQGYIGIDAFSVPVAVLRALLPANGYRFEFFWLATLPSVGLAPPGRRLLQAAATTTTTVTSGLAIMVAFLPAGAFDPADPLMWDQGSTTTPAMVSFVALPVASIAAVFVLTAIKAAFMRK